MKKEDFLAEFKKALYAHRDTLGRDAVYLTACFKALEEILKNPAYQEIDKNNFGELEEAYDSKLMQLETNHFRIEKARKEGKPIEKMHHISRIADRAAKAAFIQTLMENNLIERSIMREDPAKFEFWDVDSDGYSRLEQKKIDGYGNCTAWPKMVIYIENLPRNEDNQIVFKGVSYNLKGIDTMEVINRMEEQKVFPFDSTNKTVDLSEALKAMEAYVPELKRQAAVRFTQQQKSREKTPAQKFQDELRSSLNKRGGPK